MSAAGGADLNTVAWRGYQGRIWSCCRALKAYAFWLIYSATVSCACALLPMQVHLQIDDPLDSSVVHFVSGSFGVLLNGFLAKPSYIQSMTGRNCGGVIYNTNGGMQLGIQILGELAWWRFA